MLFTTSFDLKPPPKPSFRASFRPLPRGPQALEVLLRERIDLLLPLEGLRLRLQDVSRPQPQLRHEGPLKVTATKPAEKEEPLPGPEPRQL